MPRDSEHGCNTPGTNGRGVHVGEPLTVAQIRDLPHGIEVVTTWDGVRRCDLTVVKVVKEAGQ